MIGRISFQPLVYVARIFGEAVLAGVRRLGFRGRGRRGITFCRLPIIGSRFGILHFYDAMGVGRRNCAVELHICGPLSTISCGALAVVAPLVVVGEHVEADAENSHYLLAVVGARLRCCELIRRYLTAGSVANNNRQ